MRKNRSFLMLAQTFDPDKHAIGGWFMSEKRDGQRCFWDGGVSRNVPKSDVPWANTDKDTRYVEEQIATGLWTRLGNVIHAPDYFLDRLPPGICLDGELYLGRGQFQETRKVVSRIEPDSRWSAIRFLIFENPSPHVVFQSGRINDPNFKKHIVEDDCAEFYAERKGAWNQVVRQFGSMAEILDTWRRAAPVESLWFPMEQAQLPYDEDEARELLYTTLEKVTRKGGEGLVLRASLSQWDAVRTKYLLKVKKMDDDEGIITGYKWGVEGVDQKLLGAMGALYVEWNGKKFKVGGFTDAERMMCVKANNNYVEARCMGERCAGEDVIPFIHNPEFPRGSKIRFRYTGFTDEGIPREARYYR